MSEPQSGEGPQILQTNGEQRDQLSLKSTRSNLATLTLKMTLRERWDKLTPKIKMEMSFSTSLLISVPISTNVLMPTHAVSKEMPITQTGFFLGDISYAYMHTIHIT